MHDVKCKVCKVITYDDYVPVSDIHNISPCTCGGERAITYEGWGRDRSRMIDAFSPIKFQGEQYNTREEWNAAKQRHKEIHGVDLIVEGQTPRQLKARIEENLHKNIMHLKKMEKRTGRDYSSRIRDLENRN